MRRKSLYQRSLLAFREPLPEEAFQSSNDLFLLFVIFEFQYAVQEFVEEHSRRKEGLRAERRIQKDAARPVFFGA